MKTITLSEGQALHVTINGQTIRVEHITDDEGHGITVSGVDCDLEGEMPGEYWLAPSGTIAARYGG